MLIRHGKPVKDYIRDHIKPNDREKCYFDSYEPSELEQVIKTQQKVIDYQKEQKTQRFISDIDCY